jgi:hypothetical protein
VQKFGRYFCLDEKGYDGDLVEEYSIGEIKN